MALHARRKARYAAQANILKAMAHPTRLLLVDALTRKERCVRALTRLVGADISTVSKHLSILKNAGIVADEKRGSQVFYSLRCPCVTQFFRCVEQVLRRHPRAELARGK